MAFRSNSFSAHNHDSDSEPDDKSKALETVPAKQISVTRRTPSDEHIDFRKAFDFANKCSREGSKSPGRTSAFKPVIVRRPVQALHSFDSINTSITPAQSSPAPDTPVRVPLTPKHTEGTAGELQKVFDQLTAQLEHEADELNKDLERNSSHAAPPYLARSDSESGASSGQVFRREFDVPGLRIDIPVTNLKPPINRGSLSPNCMVQSHFSEERRASTGDSEASYSSQPTYSSRASFSTGSRGSHRESPSPVRERFAARRKADSLERDKDIEVTLMSRRRSTSRDRAEIRLAALQKLSANRDKFEDACSTNIHKSSSRERFDDSGMRIQNSSSRDKICDSGITRKSPPRFESSVTSQQNISSFMGSDKDMKGMGSKNRFEVPASVLFGKSLSEEGINTNGVLQKSSSMGWVNRSPSLEKVNYLAKEFPQSASKEILTRSPSREQSPLTESISQQFLHNRENSAAAKWRRSSSKEDPSEVDEYKKSSRSPSLPGVDRLNGEFQNVIPGRSYRRSVSQESRSTYDNASRSQSNDRDADASGFVLSPYDTETAHGDLCTDSIAEGAAAENGSAHTTGQPTYVALDQSMNHSDAQHLQVDLDQSVDSSPHLEVQHMYMDSDQSMDHSVERAELDHQSASEDLSMSQTSSQLDTHYHSSSDSPNSSETETGEDVGLDFPQALDRVVTRHEMEIRSDWRRQSYDSPVKEGTLEVDPKPIFTSAENIHNVQKPNMQVMNFFSDEGLNRGRESFEAGQSFSDTESPEVTKRWVGNTVRVYA